MSRALSHKNELILAAAGSGKTTEVVRRALADRGKRTLITTYTRENLDQLRSTFLRENGCVPVHVRLATWYEFLLSDGVRPYQKALGIRQRIATFVFTSIPLIVQRRVKREESARYYLSRNGAIYKDRTAEFVWHANTATGGKVVSRLAARYDAIYVDEVQDMCGWDLELLEECFRSPIPTLCVGDLRQATYSTHNTRKHAGYRGAKLKNWFELCEKKGLLSIKARSESLRCNQAICDIADGLYPSMPKTTSRMTTTTEHDGWVSLTRVEVDAYYAKFRPMVLKWDKSSDVRGLPSMNFGLAKGQTFDRVMLFATKDMATYMQTGNGDALKEVTRAKLYVGLTRAMYSVAVVVD